MLFLICRRGLAAGDACSRCHDLGEAGIERHVEVVRKARAVRVRGIVYREHRRIGRDIRSVSRACYGRCGGRIIDRIDPEGGGAIQGP